MSLGANRDYKTTDRRARKNLSIHKQLMAEFIGKGFSPEQASKKAMSVMRGERVQPDAVNLIDALEFLCRGHNGGHGCTCTGCEALRSAKEHQQGAQNSIEVRVAKLEETVKTLAYEAGIAYWPSPIPEEER